MFRALVVVQGTGVKEESVSPGNPRHFTSWHFNILNRFFKLSSCFNKENWLEAVIVLMNIKINIWWYLTNLSFVKVLITKLGLIFV